MIVLFRTLTFRLGTYSAQSPICTTKHIGPILETALQRAPILYIQTGNIQAAVNRYRCVYGGIIDATYNTRNLYILLDICVSVCVCLHCFSVSLQL